MQIKVKIPGFREAKRFYSVLVLFSLFAVFGGVAFADWYDDETALVDRQQAQYQKYQPLPYFEWSQDRDTMIKILTLKNEARNTFTVLTSDGTGLPRYSCASRGYPLPADTQLTNPIRPVWRNWVSSEYEGVEVGQPEANGLFSSENTDATYVLCARQGNLAAPVYTEMKATAFPFEVQWNPETGMFTRLGDKDPLVTITVGEVPANLKASPKFPTVPPQGR